MDGLLYFLALWAVVAVTLLLIDFEVRRAKMARARRAVGRTFAIITWIAYVGLWLLMLMTPNMGLSILILCLASLPVFLFTSWLWYDQP